jgi:hypothetical protein
MSHDMISTKFKNISKIGVWSDFGGPYEYQRVLGPGTSMAQLSHQPEGSLQPPSLWVYDVAGRFAQNTVFCKLIIILIVYFNHTC